MENIPELGTTIQECLLDALYLLLIDVPCTDMIPSDLQDRIRGSFLFQKRNRNFFQGLRSPEMVVVALEVLSDFDFGDRDLLSFAKEHVYHILSESPTCRVRAAVLTSSIQIARKNKDSDSVLSLLEDVMTLGVSDTNDCVRYSLWKALLDCPELDSSLLNCNASVVLLLGLGDPSMEVQFIALKLIGRLIGMGGDFLEDVVLEKMHQLLQQLELSFDKERNQVCTEVLSQLIQSCPSVVTPRANVITKTLIHLLKRQLQPPARSEPTGDSEERNPSPKWLKERFLWTSTGVVAAALQTVGHLADHAGSFIDKDVLQTLLELTVAALQKTEIEKDSIEAVRTLGKVVSSTGAVDRPYHQFSWLLLRLLDMLQVDDREVRTTVARTLGVLCAIDPSSQRRIQAQASGEGRLELEGVRPIKKPKDDSELESTPEKATMDLLVSSGGQNSEESYSLFAMTALLKVLKQRSLSAFHRDAVCVLGRIISSLSVSCVQYLNILVPNWCDAVYSGDEDIKHHILREFIRLVTIYKQYIRLFLKHLMKLIRDLWTVNCTKETLLNLMQLLKEVASICRHDMEGYFSWLVPKMLLLLETESWELIPVALDTIVELGPALHRHLHQILPTIARLALSPCMRGRERIQTAILCALEQICHILSVPELAGTVFTPLMTLLQRMECDKDKAVDVLAAAIYAGRLDSKAFRPIKALVQSKNIRNKKLNVLSVNMFRSRSRDLDLNGAWRASFEKPVSLVLTERQDDNQERRPHFSDRDLRQVWNAEQRYTYQDWLEWMRENTLELLRSSPSPALRACHDFAVNIPSVAKDLFSASFVSCWSELVPDVQKEFIRHLEAAMANISIPPEILTTLLNLAEFMEHNGYQLPLDRRTLAALSMKCQAFAKALHYKEMEFQDSPEQAVDIMLAIYNQCFLPASANGFLNYARDVLNMEIKDSWYEKLHKWETALLMYQQRAEEPLVEIEQAIEANLGCIRCHSALWQWAELNKLCQKQWAIADPTIRKQIAPYAAQAAWKMDEWEAMSDYLKAVDVDEDNSADASTCAFLCSVNKIHFHQFEEAQTFIDKARLFLSADLAALSGESYERAYEKMVRVQQLSELEEAIQIIRSKEKGNSERQQRIIEFWTKRLSAVQKRADVWESCLSVRSLVISPENDLLTWMKFAAMCRKQDRAPFAKSLLIKLLGYDPITVPKGAIGYGAGSGKPEVMFAYLKHVFGTSEDNSDIEQDAIDRLKDMIDHDNLEIWFASKPNGLEIAVPSVPLISRACVVLSKWKQKMNFRESLNQSEHIQTLIDLSNRACYYAKDWAKAWRDWAVHHLIAVDHYKASSDLASKYVAPAVRGFFQALKLSQESALRGGMLGSGPSKDTYQDILRLLTLWFSHGDAPNVIDELTKGFGMVRIETWIVVIPQIIARIHVQSSHVQELIHQLLKKIGQAHPQALLYPILVASYNVNGRRSVPSEALELMRLTYPALVNEGELIGRRFVDIAVLWDERWHEALEEASKCYFNEMDIPQMLNVLLPLHQELESFAAMTNSEQRFRNTYSNPLNEAYQLLSRYSEDNDQTLIQKAWDIYYSIFRKIDRSIRDMMVLHLSDVAPDLLDRSMSVAIPGTYSPFNSEQVCIDRIVPEIQVLNTKQRPRKLTIEGNDGNDYIFLLKGHEDLRQDERVMQLFGLVNTILASDFNSCEQELSIARYAVTPLSPNVGLIGWVPNCDTLHALIKEYREVKGIPINTEHQLMKGFAPNCENLMLIQKVEVFRYALDATVGDDLKTIMWMKSSSSEHWLAHRTNYIRSCAVMSIVGYFLGLGDRHPSNLMIDRYTGKLVHIDFGDCFESGMHREKFPEKVPFRLTRMMVKAMEVTGIEGTFRKTCELVMQVLRGEKQTLMAMLEAFVYDPLINWRLALPTTQDEETSLALAGLYFTKSCVSSSALRRCTSNVERTCFECDGSNQTETQWTRTRS